MLRCRCGTLKTGSMRIGRSARSIRSLRRTMAEGDSHLFNMLVTDIHPYVQDQMFAEREGIFGKRLIAGAFVFSAGLGLVATNCVNAFSYGYDKLRFIKPVFIGDTIYDPHQPR
jgi:acyl dehydratase